MRSLLASTCLTPFVFAALAGPLRAETTVTTKVSSPVRRLGG
jgi:hypothetical protein